MWEFTDAEDVVPPSLLIVSIKRGGLLLGAFDDAGTLRAGLMADQYQVGDFEFARHGTGTGFESFMVVGKGLYLICNNTAQTMDVITKDPLWIAAQVPFVELSEKFRADPLSAA